MEMAINQPLLNNQQCIHLDSDLPFISLSKKFRRKTVYPIEVSFRIGGFKQAA
jgi:hypothetical protein